MKRIYLCLIFLVLFILINSKTLDEGLFVLDSEVYAQPDLSHLSEVLYDLKPSEISLCISFARKPDMDSRQIADFLFGWNPEKHRKTIASVFRTKITRLAERLKKIDYEQLIIDIDLIKNSHLTTGQIIRLIKGIRRQ